MGLAVYIADTKYNIHFDKNTKIRQQPNANNPKDSIY